MLSIRFPSTRFAFRACRSWLGGINISTPTRSAGRRRARSANRILAREQACCCVIGEERPQGGIGLGADRKRARTSRAEPAATGQARRIGRLALQRERIGDTTSADVGNGCQKGLSIGVLRHAEELLGW